MQFLGGQFHPESGGQFEMETGGQFQMDLGGQFAWIFQVYFSIRKIWKAPDPH